MAPSDQSYDAKVKALINDVRHHVEEEEGEMFKKAKKVLTKDQIESLGDRMAAAKQRLSKAKSA
jgi:hemerythrin-like domain-containing protein